MAPRIRKLAHLSDECVVGVVLDSDNRMAAANDFGVSTFTLDNELMIRGYQSYTALRTGKGTLPRWRNEWSVEKVARLRELVADGKSSIIIAEALETTKNAVIGKCSRLGIVMGRPKIQKTRTPAIPIGSIWTDDKVTRLHDLVAAGKTMSAIAGELGVSKNAVIGKCNRLGINTYEPARRPARRPDYRRAAYAGSPQDLTIHRHFGGSSRTYIVPSRRKQKAARIRAKASAAEDRALIDAAIAEGKVTKCPPGHAFGWDGDAMVDRMAR